MAIQITKLADRTRVGICSCGEQIVFGCFSAYCLKCRKEYNAVGQEIETSDYYDSDENDY